MPPKAPPALAGLDQHRDGVAAEQGRGGVVARLAGHLELGRHDVGHRRLLGLDVARPEAGERDRGAHDPQHVAPARLAEQRRKRRELRLDLAPERRRVGKLLEAAPAARRAAALGLLMVPDALHGHRWQM